MWHVYKEKTIPIYIYKYSVNRQKYTFFAGIQIAVHIHYNDKISLNLAAANANDPAWKKN